MKEVNLKKYFDDLITAEELSKNSEGFEDIEIGEFEVSKFHLIKICNDFINKKLDANIVNAIASTLIFSSFYTWNGNSIDGKIISEIVFDWNNSEIGFDLTKENFEHWKEYLETGSTKYLTKEELKKKFRGMKYLIIIFITLNITSSFTNKKTKQETSFDCFFRSSKYGFNDKEKFQKWNYETADTAVYTFSYVRGDCCGGVPNPEIMKAKIINDTIFYNNGRREIPDCDKKIGLCGSLIDFVVNKKKYPNYKKLKWKEVPDDK